MIVCVVCNYTISNKAYLFTYLLTYLVSNTAVTIRAELSPTHRIILGLLLDVVDGEVEGNAEQHSYRN